MVLQQGLPVPIWGWADPGEEVTVTFADQTKEATADADGKWMVKLNPLTVGGPHQMTIAAKNTIVLEDILVGEVWLGSGQSNMAMGVRSANNGQDEVAAANYPKIRLFTVGRTPSAEPQDNCKGRWATCSPNTVGGFSATAYFFGRHLHQHLNVPVGLINSSVGGTRIEAWTSQPALSRLEFGRGEIDKQKQTVEQYDPDAAKRNYDRRLAKWEERRKTWQQAKKAGKAKGRAPRKPRRPVHPSRNQNAPSALYNGMIAPLIPFAIRGALWYQGERNCAAGSAYEYRNLLPNLIRNWREDWHQNQFPFLFVQLPNWRGRHPDAWAVIRESFLLASQSTPATGLAVTIDIGDTKDIHPKNKQGVGERLGLAARRVAYGEDLVFSGPIYKAKEIRDARIAVVFDHTGSGLTAKGDKLEGFTVAGKDRRFVPAQARIENSSTVLVWSDQVQNPVAARYAWANDPAIGLYNKEGLPASPFRTDDWPVPGQASAVPAPH